MVRACSYQETWKRSAEQGNSFGLMGWGSGVWRFARTGSGIALHKGQDKRPVEYVAIRGEGHA